MAAVIQSDATDTIVAIEHTCALILSALTQTRLRTIVRSKPNEFSPDHNWTYFSAESGLKIGSDNFGICFEPGLEVPSEIRLNQLFRILDRVAPYNAASPNQPCFVIERPSILPDNEWQLTVIDIDGFPIGELLFGARQCFVGFGQEPTQQTLPLTELRVAATFTIELPHSKLIDGRPIADKDLNFFLSSSTGHRKIGVRPAASRLKFIVTEQDMETDRISDATLKLTVVLGQVNIRLKEFLSLRPGDLIILEAEESSVGRLELSGSPVAEVELKRSENGVELKIIELLGSYAIAAAPRRNFLDNFPNIR